MAKEKKVTKENGSEKQKLDREARLKKLAGKRVSRAVKMIQLVGNLAAYKPTPKQAEAILKALEDAVNATEDRFSAAPKPAAATFSLPE